MLDMEASPPPSPTPSTASTVIWEDHLYEAKENIHPIQRSSNFNKVQEMELDMEMDELLELLTKPEKKIKVDKMQRKMLHLRL